MFEHPRCIQNSFNIFFPRQLDIRRKASELEDALRGNYAPPLVLPVPDNLDPDLPRMIFSSPHGFSQVVVSQTCIALNVRYSSDWQMDSEKRKDYLVQKIPLLFQLLKTVSAPCFCGWVTHVRLMGKNVTDEAIIAYLVKRYLKEEAVQPYSDLQIASTVIFEEMFFSNVTVKNYHVGILQGGESGISRLSRADVNERGIEIVMDFNDRHAFNENESYVTCEKTAITVMQKSMSEIAKIVSYIREDTP